MDSFRHLCFVIFIVFIFFSCSQKRPKNISRAYYYWRMNNLTTNEQKFLKQHSIEKLYVHLMDVDWNEVYGPVPVIDNKWQFTNEKMKIYNGFPNELIPVVFITNKTFEHISSSDIPLLATRVARRCLPSYDSTDKDYEERHYLANHNRVIKPKEIQIDCDWTAKTSKNYFSFLREIKKRLPVEIKLSATIRLHQFKYPGKTSVPPVDRGMLMVYNISDPKRYTDDNSIFESDNVRSYFNSVKTYPLPLDIALPAWSWCIIYRDKQFYQIENELTEEELMSASFLKPKGNHFYSVIKDTVYRDLYLRPGDEIKAEVIDKKDLETAVRISKKAVNSESLTISLFELSEEEFQRYNHETIDKVYSSFR